MNIQIMRATDSTKISYKKLIERDTIAQNKDKKKMLTLATKLENEKDSEKNKSLNNKLTLALNSYEIFKKDSLIFPILQKSLYTSLIDSVYDADKEMLENSIQNKHRIVLDGTHYNITIIAKDGTRKSV